MKFFARLIPAEKGRSFEHLRRCKKLPERAHFLQNHTPIYKKEGLCGEKPAL